MFAKSRCFAFRALITQALKFEKVFELKTFFLFNWHFKREKSVFWKASFFPNKNWLHEQAVVYTTLRLVRISLLISTIKNSFAFFLGKVNLQSNRELFSCICIAWYKHSSGWENSWGCLEFSQPLSCLYQAMQTRKTFSIAEIFYLGWLWGSIKCNENCKRKFCSILEDFVYKCNASLHVTL